MIDAATPDKGRIVSGTPGGRGLHRGGRNGDAYARLDIEADGDQSGVIKRQLDKIDALSWPLPENGDAHSVGNLTTSPSPTEYLDQQIAECKEVEAVVQREVMDPVHRGAINALASILPLFSSRPDLALEERAIDAWRTLREFDARGFALYRAQFRDRCGGRHVGDLLDKLIDDSRAKNDSLPMPPGISANEWQEARSAPECIVENYLYADVAVLVAPGGMGKTTIILYEAIHIVLGAPLYGLIVQRPGIVFIITAEDTRELLVAKLRALAVGMDLSATDIKTVMQRVRISDVSGDGFKITEIVGDVVKPSAGIDAVIDAALLLLPVLVVFDPAVSFGVGETRVNDAEQGLIEAARRLRRAVNCCVRFLQHSGKQNARDKMVDQYSGRGGSAMADGARMVHVLQSLTPEQWRDETGSDLSAGESGLRLARPKMSYCPPTDDILIRRAGYRFTQVGRTVTGSEVRLNSIANQVWQLLSSELTADRYHSRNTMESLAKPVGLKRTEMRAAVDWLTASRRIESRLMPGVVQRGGRKEYLHPIASPDVNGEATEETTLSFADVKTEFASPPPIGIISAANQAAPKVTPSPVGSPETHGEPTARLAKQKKPKDSHAD